jgi:hypothetical protein
VIEIPKPNLKTENQKEFANSLTKYLCSLVERLNWSFVTIQNQKTVSDNKLKGLLSAAEATQRTTISGVSFQIDFSQNGYKSQISILATGIYEEGAWLDDEVAIPSGFSVSGASYDHPFIVPLFLFDEKRGTTVLEDAGYMLIRRNELYFYPKLEKMTGNAIIRGHFTY